MGSDLEMRLDNHLLLFWWIMDFWKGKKVIDEVSGEYFSTCVCKLRRYEDM